MAKHRTRYTYNADSSRCTIEHAISANVRGHSDASNRRHIEIVERAQPKRAGQWELIRSGGAGSSGAVDHLGMEHTYYAEWRRTDVARDFYLVEQGRARRVDPARVKPDGFESVLTYAHDRREANRLAMAYDEGRIELRNIPFNGGTVAALSL